MGSEAKEVGLICVLAKSVYSFEFGQLGLRVKQELQPLCPKLILLNLYLVVPAIVL